jgi:alpha-beta hydrolase superfamily lysophospholipase
VAVPWSSPEPGPRRAPGVTQALAAAVPQPTPVWLKGGGWPLFGLLQEPARPACGAVVLCPPLFGEQFAAQPLYRAVSHALAERGLIVLRFDYEGSGDSGGPSSGPGRLEAWLDGVDRAVVSARERCDGPIALLGVRSGALVAAAACERRGDVDAIVLWDPWRSGRAFLRRERALQAMLLRTSPSSRQVEVPGFVVDAATADTLSGLRLAPRLRARRALLVVRPGSERSTVPLAARRGGSAVRTTADVLEAAPGEQEALFEMEPLRRRVPVVTAASVVRWLADAVTGLGGRPGGGTLPPHAAGERRPVRPATVAGNLAVAIPPAAPGEVTVFERAVRIGPHGLFGVETFRGTAGAPDGSDAPDTPDGSDVPDTADGSVGPDAPAGPDAPVVLFLPSATDSHIGPNRLWVTLARRWAALGAHCIRADFSGLGESGARPGRPELVMRAPEAFDDVAEMVEAAGGPRRVVLVGLCSSAYQALESALELEPLAVLCVNPILRFTPPEVAHGDGVSPRRRLCLPRPAWEADARRILPEPAGRALASARRRLQRARSSRRTDGSLIRQLTSHGVGVYCVCGEYEAHQLAMFGLVDRPADGLRIEVMPDLDHGLAVAAQRDRVMERLTAALLTMVGPRLGERPAGGVSGVPSCGSGSGGLTSGEPRHDELRVGGERWHA